MLCFDFWSRVTWINFWDDKMIILMFIVTNLWYMQLFYVWQIVIRIFPTSSPKHMNLQTNLWYLEVPHLVKLFTMFTDYSGRSISRHWVTGCNNTPALIQLLQTPQDLQLICHHFLTLKRYFILWLPLSPFEPLI